MAFPSATGTKKDSLSDAWRTARHTASHIKGLAVSLRNASAAGPIRAEDVIDFCVAAANAIDAFDSTAAVPGIANYARGQLDTPALDIAAEFQAMRSGCVGCRNWIIANFPKDGSGYLLFVSLDADGRRVHRTLSTAATAGLRTALDLLIATVD